jgi:hypothetical protein
VWSLHVAGCGLIGDLKDLQFVMSVGCSFWFQDQSGSGEAAFDEAGLVMDFLQAVPDDLDQVGEAGDGQVGQHAALEHRPDSLNRLSIVRGSLASRP